MKKEGQKNDHISRGGKKKFSRKSGERNTLKQNGLQGGKTCDWEKSLSTHEGGTKLCAKRTGKKKKKRGKFRAKKKRHHSEKERGKSNKGKIWVGGRTLEKKEGPQEGLGGGSIFLTKVKKVKVQKCAKR